MIFGALEYIDPLDIFITILSMGTLFGLLYISYGDSLEKGREFKNKYIFILIAAAIIIMPFYNSIDNKERILSNIQSFKDKKPLECRSGSQKYMVLSSDGWSLVGDRLLRESHLINIERCKNMVL